MAFHEQFNRLSKIEIMKRDNKVLLYDDYCPLCSWYSGLFVKYGLLDASSRVAFSTADIKMLTSIDIEKAKDEIPLFDKNNIA